MAKKCPVIIWAEEGGLSTQLSPCYLVVGRWLCCDHGKAVGIKGPKLVFALAPPGGARGSFAHLPRAAILPWMSSNGVLCANGPRLPTSTAACFLIPMAVAVYYSPTLYYTTTEKRLSRVTFVSVPIQKWPLQHIFVLVSRGIWKKKSWLFHFFFVKCRLGDIDSERLLLKQ